jgi:hypothetical protein
MKLMQLVETPIFTEAIEELLEHEAYRLLQFTLIVRPEEGVVILLGSGKRSVRTLT